MRFEIKSSCKILPKNFWDLSSSSVIWCSEMFRDQNVIKLATANKTWDLSACHLIHLCFASPLAALLITAIAA